MAFNLLRIFEPDQLKDFAREQLHKTHLREISLKLMVITAWYYWDNSWTLQHQGDGDYITYDRVFVKTFIPLMLEQLAKDHCPEAVGLQAHQRKELFKKLHDEELGPYAWRMTEEMFESWKQEKGLS